MPRLYATEQEYRDAVGDQARTASPLELLSASQLIDRATAGAIFSTYADGSPADPGLAAAFRAATCAVLDYRRVGVIDTAAAVVQGMRAAGLSEASIGGTRYKVSDQPTDAEADPQALPWTAHAILLEAGLVGGPVIIYG